MGKVNNELNYFLKDNQVFADVVNLAVHDGKKVVKAAELEEQETVHYLKNAQGELSERRNDVSKQHKSGRTYRIFCLENENKVSYVMPVRGMEYEAGQYREQLLKIGNSHDKSDYDTWSEYSSKFKKIDKLHPVITLILYWKREQWDGARTLQEMLDLTEEEKEELSPFLQDYHLNLINMYELQNLDACESQLKYVLKLIKLDQDKAALYREITENSDYKNLTPETGRVLGTLMGDQRISQKVEEQMMKGENANMCKALEELWADARNEGINQGVESEKKTIILNMIKHNVSDTDICVLTECTPEFLETVKREQDC